jgi:hypothetical protein
VVFPETRIKKAAADLIDSLSILWTLHYKRAPPTNFGGVLECSKS